MIKGSRRMLCAVAMTAALSLALSVLGGVPASAASKKRPDLVVTKTVVKPTKVAAGGVLKVSDTTRNKGRKAAKKSVTRYALSKNKRLDKKDIVLGNRAVKKLKPRKAHAVKARKVRVPARTKPGKYWLLACADAKQKVKESNERNNCRTAKKRVTVTKRKPAARPGLPWANDKPGQVRKIPVEAKITVDWKEWHTWFDSEHNLADNSSATFNVRNSGQLMLSGGKPMYLQLYTFKSGTGRGVRTYFEQNPGSCLTKSGEFRAGPESIARSDGNPAAQWLVAFPHPFGTESGVVGGLMHTFSGHGPLNVSGCDTYTSELDLEVDAGYDGPVVKLSWSKDLTRVTFTHRKDIHNTQTRKLGTSSNVTVELTHK